MQPSDVYIKQSIIKQEHFICSLPHFTATLHCNTSAFWVILYYCTSAFEVGLEDQMIALFSIEYKHSFGQAEYLQVIPQLDQGLVFWNYFSSKNIFSWMGEKCNQSYEVTMSKPRLAKQQRSGKTLTGKNSRMQRHLWLFSPFNAFQPCMRIFIFIFFP